MDVDAVRFAELVEEAGREIAEQVATNILIIEDEPIIAMDIEALAVELGHRVIDIARTRREAVAIDGTSELIFDPDGIRWTLRFPAEYLAEVDADPESNATHA